jgi:hypothetical protein
VFITSRRNKKSLVQNWADAEGNATDTHGPCAIPVILYVVFD